MRGRMISGEQRCDNTVGKVWLHYWCVCVLNSWIEFEDLRLRVRVFEIELSSWVLMVLDKWTGKQHKKYGGKISFCQNPNQFWQTRTIRVLELWDQRGRNDLQCWPNVFLGQARIKLILGPPGLLGPQNKNSAKHSPMIFAQFGTFFFWLRMLSLAQLDQLLKKYQNSPHQFSKFPLGGNVRCL